MATEQTLQVATDKVRELLDAAEAFTIDSQPLYTFADAEVASISNIEKQLEERRVAEKKPHLEAGRAVDEAYRPALDFCARAKTIYRQKMAAYYQQQQAEQSRLAAQKTPAADPADPFAVSVAPAVTVPIGAHTHARERWTIEVADLKAYLRAALRKPELLQRISIDTSDLQSLVTRAKGDAALPPGLVARKDTLIASNGGRRGAAK